MAINRDVFCKYIRKDGSEPAYAFVPPKTAGNDGKTFREEYGSNFLKYDVAKQRNFLKKVLKK